DAEYNGQLVGHLQSADFFDAETHPTITYNVTGSADGNVNGNLTIKGVENEVSIPTTLAWEGDNMSANGTVTIDRTKWELKYGSANFFVDLVADKVISDEIKLDVALMASK
ncbi:MAG: YceI family protein, partial [Bacteroidota bacterium]